MPDSTPGNPADTRSQETSWSWSNRSLLIVAIGATAAWIALSLMAHFLPEVALFTILAFLVIGGLVAGVATRRLRPSVPTGVRKSFSNVGKFFVLYLLAVGFFVVLDQFDREIYRPFWTLSGQQADEHARSALRAAMAGFDLEWIEAGPTDMTDFCPMAKDRISMPPTVWLEVREQFGGCRIRTWIRTGHGNARGMWYPPSLAAQASKE